MTLMEPVIYIFSFPSSHLRNDEMAVNSWIVETVSKPKKWKNDWMSSVYVRKMLQRKMSWSKWKQRNEPKIDLVSLLFWFPSKER